jgi:hypothetical protein
VTAEDRSSGNDYEYVSQRYGGLRKRVGICITSNIALQEIGNTRLSANKNDGKVMLILRGNAD